MNEAQKIREAPAPAPLRAERSAAALVAQYIHELSARHAAGGERGEGSARRDEARR